MKLADATVALLREVVWRDRPGGKVLTHQPACIRRAIAALPAIPDDLAEVLL